jgi:hypothetical protein
MDALHGIRIGGVDPDRHGAGIWHDPVVITVDDMHDKPQSSTDSPRSASPRTSAIRVC